MEGAGTQDYGQRVIGVWDTLGRELQTRQVRAEWLACTWTVAGQGQAVDRHLGNGERNGREQETKFRARGGARGCFVGAFTCACLLTGPRDKPDFSPWL